LCSLAPPPPSSPPPLLTRAPLRYFDFETGKCLGEFDYIEKKDDDSLGLVDHDVPDDLSATSSILQAPKLSPTQSQISAAVTDLPVVYAMVCLEHYPLLAMSMSDGKIAIYGMRTAHPRIRNTKLFEFENLPPVTATYDAENEQAYPLLHMPRKEDALYKPHAVTHNPQLRRRSSSAGFAAEEESDEMWVTKVSPTQPDPTLSRSST
jgi:hypothetical protein